MTSNEAKNLAHCLKHKNLPGLSKRDKYQLIAMVNTIVEVSKGMSTWIKKKYSN